MPSSQDANVENLSPEEREFLQTDPQSRWGRTKIALIGVGLLVVLLGCLLLHYRGSAAKGNEAAVKKITDQPTAGLATENPVNQIQDKPALATESPVNQIQDEPALADLVIAGKDAQLHKITDPALLAKVALEAKNVNTREIAVHLLSKSGSQPSLAEVALKAKDDQIRGTAVWALTDQAALAKVALKDSSYRIRRHAIRQVHNETVLAKAAVEDADGDARNAAMALISMPETRQQVRKLRTLRTYSSYGHGTLQTSVNLTEERARADEAERKNEFAARKAALAQMDDEQLKEAAKSAADPAMRLAASVRARHVSWMWVLNEANEDRTYLGLALCALAYDAKQIDLASPIASLCREYVLSSDLEAKRVCELKELLSLYGTPALAEAYGKTIYPSLKKAAFTWSVAREDPSPGK